MRIVSLAPSSTVTLEHLGKSDQIVATAGPTRQRYESLGGWLTFDPSEVPSYNPDIVVTTDALQSQILERIENIVSAKTVHLDPQTLEQTLNSFVTLGAAVNAPEQGRKLRSKIEHKLEQMQNTTRQKPTVYCEEWDSPPMAAGNWVPDIVELVGGEYPFNSSGKRSQEVTETNLQTEQPDIVILHACGDRVVKPSDFVQRPSWDIPEVSESTIVSIPDSWLNQPSPNLVKGARAVNRLVVAHCLQKT